LRYSRIIRFGAHPLDLVAVAQRRACVRHNQLALGEPLLNFGIEVGAQSPTGRRPAQSVSGRASACACRARASIQRRRRLSPVICLLAIAQYSAGEEKTTIPIFGAKRYRDYLLQIGVCHPVPVADAQNPEPPLVISFRQWLERHRGGGSQLPSGSTVAAPSIS
jgi:hypothetical protein